MTTMAAVKRSRAPALPAPERRRVIVEAAIPLIAEYGRGVTSGQIARAAGVAEGTIYRVFPDKPSILRSCLVRVVDTSDLERDLHQASAGTTVERRLEATAAAVHRHLSRALPVALALGAVTGRAETGGDVGGEGPGGFERMVAVVGRHLSREAGTFRARPVTVARVLVALVFGATFQEIHTGAPHLEAREVAGVILSGLSLQAATS